LRSRVVAGCGEGDRHLRVPVSGKAIKKRDAKRRERTPDLRSGRYAGGHEV
jgi:hypothetical protein